MIFSNCFMVKSIQKKAFEFCFKNKHRYTEPRKKVLEIVSSSKKPLKAYEILEKLGLELNNPKPPTAYRAIEFWQKYNFIHRIESLNAYSACISDHLHSGTQFMICDDCGTTTTTQESKKLSSLAVNFNMDPATCLFYSQSRRVLDPFCKKGGPGVYY